LPTVIESGVPGYDTSLWYGLLGTKGLPAPVVGSWNKEIKRSIQTPEIKERFANAGLEPTPGTREAFAAVLRRDIERWAQVVKQAGITINREPYPCWTAAASAPTLARRAARAVRNSHPKVWLDDDRSRRRAPVPCRGQRPAARSVPRRHGFLDPLA